MADFPLADPIWLIGCGNMGRAMLGRWIETGVDPRKFVVVRPSGEAVAPNVRVVTGIPAGPPPSAAILAVKPQKLDEVAPALAAAMAPETLLVSILAGLEQATLRHRFPAVQHVVRAMPNTPVAIGKGAIGLFADYIDEEAEELVSSLFVRLGILEWIEDEALFDVFAALTSSGPAFVFRFIDALAQGATALGLPLEQARRLALATVEGSGALASVAGESPMQLAERVASPGGMTRQGLDVLDDSDALRSLVHRTLEAAVRRSREMGQEARRG